MSQMISEGKRHRHQYNCLSKAYAASTVDVSAEKKTAKHHKAVKLQPVMKYFQLADNIVNSSRSF